MTSLTAMRQVRCRATLAAIRGVIFDLDGTLFDSEPLYRSAFRDALSSFGLTCQDALYLQLIGLATPDRLDLLTACYGPDFPAPAFRARYADCKRRVMRDGIPLKPGAAALLDSLAARGICAAIATACSSATARHCLHQAGLQRRFAAVLTRDDVSPRKPHPEIVLSAAERLGLLPMHCLVLEDSAPGIQAAVGAGAIPILIPDLAQVPAHIQRKSFAVLPDLHAVRALLARD